MMSSSEIEGASVEMPRYKCHKQVWALKIKHIKLNVPEKPSTGATITPMEHGYAPFQVDAVYIDKHNPQVGGYYVVYDDGYKSFSPAKAFEEGYMLIDKAAEAKRAFNEMSEERPSEERKTRT